MNMFKSLMTCIVLLSPAIGLLSCQLHPAWAIANVYLSSKVSYVSRVVVGIAVAALALLLWRNWK